MPDWFRKSIDEAAAVPLEHLIPRLLIALGLGVVVAGVYRGTRRAAHVTGTFPATLVLLCVLIAMVTQVIGDNIARAFSLVGALSIVRFRTVVQDTKDTAFVIFAVVVGMAIGAGQPAVAVFGMLTVGAAAALFRDRPPGAAASDPQLLLELRLGWTPEAESLVLTALSKHATDIEPLAAGTARHGAAMELTYRIKLLSTATLTQVVADLNRVEGVQSVELKRQRDEA
jgi:uncharacterized membrane protein YhiD involved in acid resistance